MDPREKANRMGMAKRIVSHPDFAIFADYIRAKMQAHTNSIPHLIVTPEDAAKYNFHQGVLAGLQHVLDLGTIISQEEQSQK